MVELAAAGVRTPVLPHGLPPEFLPHGDRAGLLTSSRLSAQPIALAATEALLSLREHAFTRADVDAAGEGSVHHDA
jgi:hypothetical protein